MNYLFTIRPLVNTESYRILAYNYSRSHTHTHLYDHSRTHAGTPLSLSLSLEHRNRTYILIINLENDYFNNQFVVKSRKVIHSHLITVKISYETSYIRNRSYIKRNGIPIFHTANRKRFFNTSILGFRIIFVYNFIICF